jgi:hypothetical protein
MDNRREGRRPVWFVVLGLIDVDGQVSKLTILYRNPDRKKAEDCLKFLEENDSDPRHVYELGEF